MDIHSTKNHIFFQMLWKDGILKKIPLEYDHSCIIRKDDISFSRKYHLVLWTENERWWFSKKKFMEIWYFPQVFWKYSVSKKISLEYHLSFIIWKDVFFFRRKMKDDLSQEIHRNMIFSVYLYKPYKHGVTLLQKNKNKKHKIKKK